MSTLRKSLESEKEVKIGERVLIVKKVKLSQFPLISDLWEQIAKFIKETSDSSFLVECIIPMSDILRITSGIDVDEFSEEPESYIEICNAFFELNSGFFLRMQRLKTSLQNQKLDN